MKMRGVAMHAYKLMGKAVHDYDMISDGDKVLVAVSGGEDSLTMLKLFLLRMRRIPIKYTLVACFIDTDFIHINSQRLKDYFVSENVSYVIKSMSIPEEKDRNCFWCSWNRRKLLFETTKELGCNKLALGHNLDDIAQTTVMNLFFRGEISTAPANLEMFNGEFRVIRPLCYIPKKDIGEFAAVMGLPVEAYECIYGKESKRAVAREMIAAAEKDCPQVKTNIVRALRRIKEGYLN